MTGYLILFITSTLIFVWLMILTIIFWQQKKHYQQLLGNAKTSNLQDILDRITSTQKRLIQENSISKSKFKKMENDTNFYLQKIGFYRFNPFNDTGGDQSFVLSLLDNKNNGMVFTFLHSRDATRVYAKKVLNGKSDKFPLSKEEEAVIAQAAVPRL